MEDQIRVETDAQVLESKKEEIQKVKDRFNKIMMQKLGNLLVEELSKVASQNKPAQNQSVTLKFPNFLKSLFKYFNNDQLLIETALLFVVYSLKLLDSEMQIIYGQNITKIQNRKDELLKIKNLLWINKDLTPDYGCKFKVPNWLFPGYPLFEKYMPDLAVFGILKIFEWLNILSASIVPLILTYERNFNEIYKLVMGAQSP